MTNSNLILHQNITVLSFYFILYYKLTLLKAILFSRRAACRLIVLHPKQNDKGELKVIFVQCQRSFVLVVSQMVKPLSPKRPYCDYLFNYCKLVNCFRTLFLVVCSVKSTAGGRPPRRRRSLRWCRQIEGVCGKS